MLTLTAVATTGGIGKTTVSAHFDDLLCDLGHHVLLVEANPQPSLTRQASHVMHRLLWQLMPSLQGKYAPNPLAYKSAANAADLEGAALSAPSLQAY